MKKIIFLVFILLIYGSCKKRSYCGICNCVNTNNLTLLTGYVDSDTVIKSITGTWYVQQQQTQTNTEDCKEYCYCNKNYAFIILPNKTITEHLPDGTTDTLIYSYYRLYGDDTSKKIYSILPVTHIGDTSVIAEILTTNNYIVIGSPIDLYNYPYFYPDNFYILTR